MQLDVAERDRRQPSQLEPVGSAVRTDEEAALRTGEEQIGLEVILLQRPDDRPGWQVPRHRAPGAAEVGALEEVRGEVAGLVVVGGHVKGVGVVERHLDVVDEGERRQGERRRAAPAPAAVGRDLHQAVVGADRQRSFPEGRLRDRRGGGVLRHRTVVVQRVDAPDPAEELLLVAVAPVRQVAADRGPGVAPVVALPDPLGAVVDPVGAVRAHQQRRVPVPALRRVPLGGLGADHQRLLVPPVSAVEHPLLPHQIEEVRVARVEGDAVAVGAERHIPVLVADAVHVEGARWTVQGALVLQPDQDVEERLAVAERHLVDLRHRQVREVPEGPPLVEGLVQPGVGAHQEVVTVGRVDPQGMVVAVLVVAGLEGLHRRAAVSGDMEEDVHLVDPVGVEGRGLELLVIVGAGAAGDVVVLPLPALAPVA